MTIHCVTPNPAVDVTYRVDSLIVYAVNRVSWVTQRPGGKGINVARVLAGGGAEVATYGFLGGFAGKTLRDLLGGLQPAIDQRWTAIDSETRRTVAVVDDVDTTMLNEAGPTVCDDDWDRLTGLLAGHCHTGDVVTVSGSLPPGVAPGHLAALVAAVKGRGARIIVDTSGPGLLAAATAGADVLKPNRLELLQATGLDDVSAAAQTLLSAGAAAVVVSLGAEGLLLAGRDGYVSAGLGEVLHGNPTGAGDALVAALAAGLADSVGSSVHAALIHSLPNAVAWSAAAVLAPVAGEIDVTIADRLTTHVTLKEL